MLSTILDIARQMRDKSKAKEFVGTVLEILGTANSIGCTVDGCTPKEIQQGIYDGEVEIPDQ